MWRNTAVRYRILTFALVLLPFVLTACGKKGGY
jgi:predicted small lipoprotein YifL